jgi:hypothetical protein
MQKAMIHKQVFRTDISSSLPPRVDRKNEIVVLVPDPLRRVNVIMPHVSWIAVFKAAKKGKASESLTDFIGMLTLQKSAETRR